MIRDTWLSLGIALFAAGGCSKWLGDKHADEDKRSTAGISVQLAWDPPADSIAVSAYRVYAGAAGAAREELTTIEIGQAGFDPSQPAVSIVAAEQPLLAPLIGQDVCFSVHALGTTGIESEASNEVCVSL